MDMAASKSYPDLCKASSSSDRGTDVNTLQSTSSGVIPEPVSVVDSSSTSDGPMLDEEYEVEASDMAILGVYSPALASSAGPSGAPKKYGLKGFESALREVSWWCNLGKPFPKGENSSSSSSSGMTPLLAAAR